MDRLARPSRIVHRGANMQDLPTPIPIDLQVAPHDNGGEACWRSSERMTQAILYLTMKPRTATRVAEALASLGCEIITQGRRRGRGSPVPRSNPEWS